MVFGHVREFLSPELDEETRRELARRRRRADAVDGAEPDADPARRRSSASARSRRPSASASRSTGSRAPPEAGLRHAILPEVVLERRLHTQNNGLRERASRSQYLEVIRQAMERRRAAAEAAQAEDT